MKGLFENVISFWDCLLGHHKVGLAIFCVLEKEGGRAHMLRLSYPLFFY